MSHGRAEVLSEGYQHYADISSVPWDVQKYYHQRHSIFSKYDEGVWMTEDAWFGVTPEPVATAIAQHISEAAPTERAVLIDCFAGVGGNVIAFALSDRWRRVYAIEKDPNALACAKHNAEIYGVHDKISWFEGDCFEIIGKELAKLGKHSVIFASPPWGGPGYRSDTVFNLATMQPYTFKDLLDPFQKVAKQTKDEKILVMHYCMKGASKAICAYFGDFHFSGAR